ncbi:MAG: phage tail tape measure protein, partial [Prevotellaceae bacterium]|nr:phage tail tape measure protein [Prevotellaceae bacterium]
MANEIEKIFNIQIKGLDKIPDMANKIDALAKKMSEFEKVLKDVAKNNGIKEVINVFNQYNASTVTVEKSRKKLTDAEKEANKIAKLQKQATESEKGSLNQLSAQIQLNNIAYNKMSAEQRNNTVEGKALGRQLAQQRKEMREVTLAAGDFSRNIGNYASAIKSIPGMLFSIQAKYRALLQLGTMLFGTFMNFEQKMAAVRAVSQATDEEFAKLSANARKLGESTEWTATQVAELQLAYSRLGFSSDEILKITSATLDLATATGEDLAKSADVAGSTLRGFGLEADEMKRVVDVMAKSFNSTALRLDYFANSMKTVAPIAKEANVSLEETTAMLGVLADRGIRGTMAGTALRRIFTEIARDGGDVQERLSQLSEKGITVADAFDEVGRNAMTALTILANSKDGIDDLTVKFENADGAAKEAAATMRNTLTGDVKIAQSAFQEFAIWLGEQLAPAARSVVQFFTLIGQNLKDFTTRVFHAAAAWTGLYAIWKIYTAFKAKSTAVTVASATATVAETAAIEKQTLAIQKASTFGKLFAAVKFLITGNIKMATVAWKAFTVALKANPFGIVLAGITAVIGIFTLFRKKVDDATKAHNEFEKELSKEKSTLDTITKTALSAAEGTHERAEAIRLLNEKYGEYLPYLLTEKSTNEEIKKALDGVNDALEANLKLKARQQATEKAHEDLAAEEIRLLDKLKDNYDLNMPAEKARLFMSVWRDFTDAIKNGEKVAFMDIAKRLGVENDYDDVFARMNDYVEYYRKYKDKLKQIDIWYGETDDQRKKREEKEQQKQEAQQQQQQQQQEENLKKRLERIKGLREKYGKYFSADITEKSSDKDIAEAEEKAQKAMQKAIEKEKETREKAQKEAKSDIEKNADELAKLGRDSVGRKNAAEIEAMNEGIEKKLAAQDEANRKEIEKLNIEAGKVKKEIEKRQEELEGLGLKGGAEYKLLGEQKDEIEKQYGKIIKQVEEDHERKKLDIIKKASDEELETVEFTSEQIDAVQSELTKRIIENQRKQQEEFEKTQKKALQDAQTNYETQKAIINVTETKESQRSKKLIENEINLRREKFKTLEAELKLLVEIGAIDSERYQQILADLAKIRQEITNFEKGDVDENGEPQNFWDKMFNMSEEDKEKLKQQAIELAGEIGNSIIEAQQAANQRRLANEKKAIDSEYKIHMKMLDDKRDKGLISEKKYQEELEKLEAEKLKKEEEAERAAFEKDKEIRKKQALMDMA